MEKDIDMEIDQNSKPQHEVTTDIKITSEERKIFDTLLEVAKDNNLDTTIRVNGGWVRDKMLHRDSKDIDFALDNIYGAQFAEMLSKHLYPGKENKYGVIKANSDKSKHLETATLKVHGVFIDLVNLRSEEYADDSRVPTIEIGTPLQDALRRDLTINALFYNINEDKIEDFTEHGIEDLKNGVIRTPMEPLQTFLDDPLRVLRTIRFATRFNFTMVEDLNKAMQDPIVKEALAKKVTFERIGRETDLMLEGNNPSGAIEYFYKYKIFSHILKFPETCEDLQDETIVDGHTFESVRICQILGHLLKLKQDDFIKQLWNEAENAKETQKYLFYAGILMPFRNNEFTMKKGKKSKTDYVHNYVMFESLKQPNKGKNIVHTCLTHINDVIKAANSDEFDVIKIGTIIKNLGSCFGPTLMLAMAKQYFDEHLTEGDEVSAELVQEYIAKYSKFYDLVKEHKIQNAHQMKALLNGKDIMKLFEIKGGPILKTITDEVFKWQLLNPDATVEDLEKYLIEHRSDWIK